MSPAGRFRGVAAVVAFGMAAAIVGCGGDGESGPLAIRFGHVGAPGSLYETAAMDFARRANAYLGDLAEVRVFGASQLGGDEMLVQRLRLGTAELSLPSTVMSSNVEAFGLFEMPYLVRDRDHMRRIERDVFWEHLAPRAETAGLKVLAVWENGFRHVTNNVRPIVRPEDLQGIKLRTPRGLWRVRMFGAYGANPTPMPLSEVFVALQTGVMDGQENPFHQIWTLQFHEVQRYLSLTRHVYTPAYLTTSVATWSAWPQEVRDGLTRAAEETRDHVYEAAEELEREMLERLRASGIEVNEVDRDRFVEASARIYEEFGSTVEGGGEMLQAVLGVGDG